MFTYTYVITYVYIHPWYRSFMLLRLSCCSGKSPRHPAPWNWEEMKLRTWQTGHLHMHFLGPCPEIRSLQGINLYGLDHLVISRYSCSFERNPCGSTAGKTLASVGPTSRQTGLIDLCLTWRVQPELTSGLPRPRRCTGSAMHRHCTFSSPKLKDCYLVRRCGILSSFVQWVRGQSVRVWVHHCLLVLTVTSPILVSLLATAGQMLMPKAKWFQ